MANKEKKTPLDGTELLEFINSANTRQTAFGSTEDIADFINSFDIPAETLMILLLRDIMTDVRIFSDEVLKQLRINNRHLELITNEKFKEEDQEVKE